ncbi:MAG: hypothetical protein OEW32_17555 [Nitrospira sp.]|nr:hypothetical protein [Nitrospira sp.]
MRGEIVRQRGRSSSMRRGQGRASEPSPQSDLEDYQPEVLMFSRGRKLLHVNRQAVGVTGHLNHSAPLLELRNAIQAALDLRRAANVWEPIELKRVLFGGRRGILLRGLGLADRSAHDDSRIVIVMEKFDPRQERSPPL